MLKHFTGADGLNPQAGLALYGTVLYGTTYGGGSGGQGTVFQVNTDGSDFCVLKSFTGGDGSGPRGRLAWSNGALYGTTAAGGDANNGVVFALYFAIAPTILTNPASKAVTVGSAVDLLVSAAGPPPLAYQWFFDGTNALSGAASSALRLENVQLSQAGFYAVVVTNAFGAVTSAPAMLSVTASPPVILTGPSSQTVSVGDTVVLAVSSGGSLPLSYQWLFNASPIAGAGNTSLELINVQTAQSGSYTVIITNAFGSVTSPPATLTVVGWPPVIVASPASLAVPVGGTAYFQVGAVGSPPLAYQWVFNGTTAIPGATSAYLSLANVQLTQAGLYSATVSNLYGAATSAPALLQVWPPTQAQFTYTDNGDGTATITGYTGPGGDVSIPGAINGLLVTSIGYEAFYNGYANLPYILNSITIPDSVISIGDYAFAWNYSLTTATLGNGLRTIGTGAFADCGLTGVYFLGDAPSLVSGPSVFAYDNNTVYYVPGTSGWGATFGGRPTAPWFPPQSGYFCMTADGGTITITGYTGPGGDVTIPDTIYGLPVTSIGNGAFSNCTSLASLTIGNSVISIGDSAFWGCSGLTRVTLPNSVTSIRQYAFCGCSSLASVTIPDGVTLIDGWTFSGCSSLSRVMIPNGVSSVGPGAFDSCTSLTNVIIPDSVTTLGSWAFAHCFRLTGVYFKGNAPSAASDVFAGRFMGTVFYLPGTTGWGATFGGWPTAVWPAPAILTPPQPQTAEVGSAVGLWVESSPSWPRFCLWYVNATNLISCGTGCELNLTNVQFSQAGAYTAVITNAAGAVTSSPAMLQVIPPVERRPVSGIKVTGQTGSLLNVDYANALSRTPSWTTLGSVSLTSTSQYYFDLTQPLPPQRFYRAWQTGAPGVIPSMDLGIVPAITLTGSIGGSVRVDAINQFGPIDAWFTLDTVTLTNTPQLYFDTSAWRQPQRLYRLVQVP